MSRRASVTMWRPRSPRCCRACRAPVRREHGPGDEGEGEKSLRTGLATLEAKLRYMRYALGSQALNDNLCNIGEAKDLFVKLFATNSRTELDWQVETHRITQPSDAHAHEHDPDHDRPRRPRHLPCHGKGGGRQARVRRRGPGPVLETSSPKVLDALSGKEPGGGWGGGAVQPFFTSVLARKRLHA
jgi:hypothetical protein